jgi:hypothetical protein
MTPRSTFVSLLLAALVAAALVSRVVSAHDEFRFVGTVVALDLGKNRFAMKFTEHDKTEVTVTIAFTAKTEITRDKKPVPRAQLKPGSSVVVDALGDDYDNLEAVTIRIVPKI